MTAKLVLATAPVPLSERYGPLAGAGSTEPSFGVACLAACAAREGFDVHIVECSAENMDIETAANEILAFDPDVVGISSTTSGITASASLAHLLKRRKPGTVAIVGGCHVSALPEETLREFPAFDIGVTGEGELTLLDILRRFDSYRQIPADCPGTVVRCGDDIVRLPPRPLIADLDSLPLPAWNLLRGFPRSFRPSPARIRRWPCASIVLTRGCPNNCTFCDRSVFGRKCRAYSPAYAVEMIRDLRANHGVREILIEDDTFMTFRPNVIEFCERLISSGLDISWSCLGRADRVDPELLRAMKKAGCWHISYGIESGSPEILASVRKRLDIGQIRQAVAWSREAGLRTKGFFMVGFPGETPATMEATEKLALSLGLDDITVSKLTPFPGSELYADIERYGSFTRNWAAMNVLTPVFVPSGLTADDLDRAASRMLRRFYLRPGLVFRHALYAISRPRLWMFCLSALRALIRSTGGRTKPRNSHPQRSGSLPKPAETVGAAPVQPTRIGINTLYLVPGHVGGSEVYLRSTLERLVRNFPSVEFVIFANIENASSWDEILRQSPRVRTVPLPVRGGNRFARLAFEQIVLPALAKREELDILWSPGGVAPVACPVSQVVTILDMLYKDHPSDWPFAARFAQTALVPLACRVCDRIITISKFSMERIASCIRCAEGKICVTHLAADPRFQTRPDRDVRQRLCGIIPADAPWILCVANTYPHKNVHALVASFDRIAPKIPHSLVIVGSPMPKWGIGEPLVRKALARSSHRDRIIRLQNMTIENLVALYQGADLFVIPSVYEGFGLPLVEALAAGVPCIAAQRASLPEIGGDAAIYFDPDRPGALDEAILSALSLPAEERTRLVELGRARAALFSWEKTASLTMNCFIHAFADHHGSGQAASSPADSARFPQ